MWPKIDTSYDAVLEKFQTKHILCHSAPGIIQIPLSLPIAHACPLRRKWFKILQYCLGYKPCLHLFASNSSTWFWIGGLEFCYFKVPGLRVQLRRMSLCSFLKLLCTTSILRHLTVAHKLHTGIQIASTRLVHTGMVSQISGPKPGWYVSSQLTRISPYSGIMIPLLQ